MRPRLTLSAAAVVLTALLTAHLSAVGQLGLGGAVQSGDLAAVRALLGTGSDPNGAGDRFRPLATAARLAALDVMNALLDAGADPNLPDAGGNHWVPLMHAVHKHQSSSVRLLLARGARPDGPTGLRLTPLMMAVASGQTDATRLLLDRGADPHRRTREGASLLTVAVSGGALTDIDEPLLGGCHPETVRLVRERAPDLTVDRSIHGKLAVFFAWLNGCDDVRAIVNRSPSTFVQSR